MRSNQFTRLFFALPVILLLAVAACSASYKVTPTGGQEAAHTILDPSLAVLVAVPADGGYGDEPAIGSGQKVAAQAAIVFAERAAKVAVAASDLTSRDALLEAARGRGDGYVVIPSIVNWEHRATEWSGMPSRLSLNMVVLDAATGAEINVALLESRSKVSPFRSKVEMLLPHLIRSYVATIYPKKPDAG